MEKPPYHIGTSNGVHIVCNQKQREIMNWASDQLGQYNCTNIPDWVRMPSYNFEEAKKEYEKANKK